MIIPAMSQDELSPLNEEFQVPQRREEQRQKFFLIGRIIDGKFNVIHYNDQDLMGFAGDLGWPEDDDIGRTATLDIKYKILAENGRIDIDFYNQLFSRLPDPLDDETQEIMEETHLSIRMRIIHSKKDQTYVIAGGSFTNQYGKPLLMSYLQEYLHAAGGGTERTNIESDLNRSFANLIIGAGRIRTLARNSKLKVSLITEYETQISTELDKESNATFRTSLNIDYAGIRDTDVPRAWMRIKGETALFEKGRIDYSASAKVGFSFKLFKKDDWYFEPGLSVTIIRTDEDDKFEGGRSYNTGLNFEFRRHTSYEEKVNANFLFDEIDKL